MTRQLMERTKLVIASPSSGAVPYLTTAWLGTSVRQSTMMLVGVPIESGSLTAEQMRPSRKISGSRTIDMASSWAIT